MSELFDVLAYAARVLLDLKPDYQKINSSSIDIESEHPEYTIDSSMNVSNIFYYIDEYKHHDKDVFLAYCLSVIDNRIGETNEIIKKFSGGCDFDIQYVFRSLNDNSNNTGIVILPRYISPWEGRRTDENHALDINIFVRNVVICDIRANDFLNKFNIICHIINPQYMQLVTDENYNYGLVLGASPLSGKVNIFPEKTIENSVKVINAVFDNKNDKELANAVINIIWQLDEEQCDIVVFPELLGSPEMDNRVINELVKHSAKNIKIIVLPSYYETKNNVRLNSCSVISWDGEVLFRQPKLVRFKNDSFMENIDEGKDIHILYIPGIGQMAVLICRSFIENKIRGELANLKVKLLLCPSYSSGDLDFDYGARAGAGDDCNVVWSNTCSAIGDGQEGKIVTIVTSYTRNSSDIDERVHVYRKKDYNCDANCKGNCFCAVHIKEVLIDEKESEFDEQQPCD